MPDERLTVATLAAAFLFALPVPGASAAPTLTLEKDCTVPNGVRPGGNGFPPETQLSGHLAGPDGGTISGTLRTDANGAFSVFAFRSSVPGVWTFTAEWSGGTLATTLDVHCPTGRMVGKGAVTGASGVTASYVYIIRCPLIDSALNSIPFEIRFGTRRLRLTTAFMVTCFDDPAIPSAAGGFDTQTGVGQGPLTTTGTATENIFVEWKFVDGGSGGTKDSARITITRDSGAVVFEGSASPPGKFPGSTQATGFNTAQLLP